MVQNEITHIITGLGTGGAEMMLYKLLSNMDRDLFDAEVISLTGVGLVGEKIRALGVPVQALGMRRGIPDPRGILRLAKLLKGKKPQLIQTWMYHADLIGGIAARLAGGIPVAWGIHHSNLTPEGNKRTTIWTAKTCAHLSRRLPKKIVCCSEASKRVHTAIGYALKKMIVIPNGFDLAAFLPEAEARLSVRRELNIPRDAFMIGLVGRFDPQKDHRNFIAAADVLIRSTGKSQPEIHFVLCGDNITWGNQELADPITESGLQHCFHLLGRRDDMPRLNAAFDISSSSSFGEGFPNVLGEAMACGVPCVATDVGDSALIVGDTGRVVPPKNPEALAAAWRELLLMEAGERAVLGAAARQRVLDNFNLPTIVKCYETLYQEIIEDGKK